MQADDKEQTTVGASLAAGREALGITQIEAADVLNLTQRTIAALETDDYEKFAWLGLRQRLHSSVCSNAWSRC